MTAKDFLITPTKKDRPKPMNPHNDFQTMDKKEIYHSIHHAIRSHSIHCSLSPDAKEEDVRYAIRWVMRDNPDIFWFSYQYRFDPSAKMVSFKYTFSEKRCQLIQKSIDDVVKNDFCLSYVRTLSELDKVMYVYKWLLSYCNYNIVSAYNQSIASVFMRRNSVCTGYAKAAQYLFQLLDINSQIVFGRLNNDKESGRHCWNIIKVNQQYYHLDICLGDSELENTLRKAGATAILKIGSNNYNCFCVSTQEILKTRSIEDIETLPACPSSLNPKEIRRLSELEIHKRDGDKGCLLANFSSSADIFLSSKDKNTILKVFENKRQCLVEYNFISCLNGCRHLLQLNDSLSDKWHNVIAIEQSTSIADLLCSHYYHPTLHSLLMMAADVTEGWMECLQRDVLYRDIHICNIFRAKDGTYKLGDFGSCTSASLQAKDIVGNPWFMAPETYLNGHFDERSAIYGITSVLYFILNGMRPPFLCDSDVETALQRKMKGCPLPMPSLLEHLPMSAADAMSRLISKGCAYNPSERYASCKELLNFIRSILADSRNQAIDLKQTDITDGFLLHVFSSTSTTEKGLSHSSSVEIVEQTALTAAPAPPPPKNEANFSIPGSGTYTEYLEDNDGGMPEDIEDFALTAGYQTSPPTPTYLPKTNKKGFFSRLFGKKYDDVFSSVFAPAETKRGRHLLIQVYLHRSKETEKVISLAMETDKNTERRDYISLQCRLRKGDAVDVMLSIFGEKILMSQKKTLSWQGTFTKCSFDWLVPKNLEENELSCMAVLAVNGAQVGELSFIVQIKENPKMLHPEVFSRQYKKIFISYAHQDEEIVKMIAHAYDAQGVDYFFDRHYLKPGAVFPLEIEKYIDSADRFILCWSANAAKSDYVRKELKHALKRAFPNVKPIEAAPLSIYPLSIKPRADELPDEIRDIYNFEII